MNQLVWYRSDLRIRDHSALSTAVEHARQRNTLVHAVYFWSEPQLRSHGTGAAKLAAIITALQGLSEDLHALNIAFHIVTVPTWSAVADALDNLIQRLNISDLHFHIEPGLNEQRRDQQVLAMAQKTVSCHPYHDLFLVPPATHCNRQGNPYKVFTAYKKSALSQISTWLKPPLPHPAPLNQPKPDKPQFPEHAKWRNPLQLPLTEDEAHQQLDSFLARMSRYADTRDFPATDGTSRLSAALANGTLTSRQIAWAIYNSGSSLHDHTYFSEILWREFFKYVIFHRPDLCLGKPFKQRNDNFPWQHDPALLKAWQLGLTGVPIVDAAMRQLYHTGWMHNRLRMICAMYLSKILQLDWRLGETWFADKLADFDFCANNGGWQWSASTGVDAVPYFRIFNPYQQSQKFDPDGDFIRQYIPELAHLSGKQLHTPPTRELTRLAYPDPVIDYARARADTITKFKQLKDPDV